MKRYDVSELTRDSLGFVFTKILNEHKDRYLEPHTVFVRRTAEKVTLPQLKYYWGVVLEDIADQTGYWPDEIHDFNKKNFGLKTSYYIGDEAHELIKGLSKMNKHQGSDFINRAIEYWTSRGVTIREAQQLSYEETVGILVDTEFNDD